MNTFANTKWKTEIHTFLDITVHFRPYLLDGGLHLLAVDVDGYPAGAALCHKR